MNINDYLPGDLVVAKNNFELLVEDEDSDVYPVVCKCGQVLGITKIEEGRVITVTFVCELPKKGYRSVRSVLTKQEASQKIDWHSRTPVSRSKDVGI